MEPFQLHRVESRLRRRHYHIEEWLLKPKGFSLGPIPTDLRLVEMEPLSGLLPEGTDRYKVIVEEQEAPEEIYDPFEYYFKRDEGESLYLEFANLDPNNEKEMLYFVNRYGLLGLRHPSPPLSWGTGSGWKRAVGALLKMPKAELVSDFRWEWLYLNVLLDLWRALQGREEQSLRRAYQACLKSLSISCEDGIMPSSKWIPLLAGDTSWDPWAALSQPLDALLLDARRVFVLMLNSRMQAGPHLVLEEGTFSPRWATGTVLGAMYTMLYLDVTKGRWIRECQNETCGQTFATWRDNKIYCNQFCARAQAQREYRKRLKEKKGEHVPQRGVKTWV